MDEIKLKKSIKRITVFFIAVSFLIVSTGWYSASSLDNVFKETINNQVTLELNKYKNSISSRVSSDIQSLQTLSSFIEFEEDLDTQSLLQTLYKSNDHTGFLCMAYFYNDYYCTMVSTSGKIEENFPLYDLNSSAVKIIKNTWETNESGVSDVFYDEFLDKKVIAYSIPIIDDGKVEGVLSACKPIESLSETMNISGYLSKNGFAGIINNSGDIIFSSITFDNEYVSNIKNWKELDNQTEESILNSIKSASSDRINFKSGTTNYYALIEPVGINNWCVVLIDTVNGINDPMYQSLVVTRISCLAPLFFAVICVMYGYAQVKKNNTKLFKLAYFDQLTGAYNIEKFNICLKNLPQNSKDGCVVGINLRNFKFVNEIFGAEQANNLLKYIKTVLDKNIRHGEFFCRDSADKFLIYINSGQKDEIISRIEQITIDISSMSLSNIQKYPIRLYCGAAFLQDCNSDLNTARQEVMTHVMFALNYAKRNPQSNIYFYDTEMHKSDQLENYIESNMARALADGEFKMYLQPKFNLNIQKVCGAEALVRWITEDGNTIFPDKFISIFEQNGFCKNLDLYMVEQACKQIRSWIDSGIEPVPISVNQSKLLFFENDYIAQLCAITKKYGVNNNLIVLEILETICLSSTEEISKIISSLQSKGFKISMDDFGSGYSSLNTLANLKIDELKLDRAFLLSATKETGLRQKIILEQMLILAEKLDIYTVAEGVETAESVELVKKLGCDCGQGYYYSKPINAQQFTDEFMKK